MIADAVRCTHNGTGGSGTITLAAVTGYPQPTDVLGTSGTRLIAYEIAEYTDSTFATLSKYERGIGSLVLSTNVLTRTQPLVTWTSGGSYNQVNATALTFGNTAANFQILVGANTASQKLALPSTVSVTYLASDVWQPFNTRQTYDSAMDTYTVTNGQREYIPIEFIYGKPITQVAVEVTTPTAATNLRMALYEWDPATGGPGNLIVEFTSAAQIATTAAGFRPVTMAAPVSIPPGFYYIMLQADNSTVVLRTCTTHGHTLISTVGGSRDVVQWNKGAAYGAAPSTGDTSAAASRTRSAGAPIWVGYK